MMTAVTQIRQAPTAEEAARMTALWPDLLHSQIQTKEEAAEISAAVKRLSTPATKQWISGRVATLLSQYFASSIPTEVITAIAEDWHEELMPYPSWALQKAARWWMSAENDKRRQKPVAGDISARAKTEMGAVKVAESAVRRFDRSKPAPQPQETRQAPSAEQKARLDEEVAQFTARAKAYLKTEREE